MIFKHMHAPVFQALQLFSRVYLHTQTKLDAGNIRT